MPSSQCLSVCTPIVRNISDSYSNKEPTNSIVSSLICAHAAPWVFTKILKSVLALLQQWDFRFIAYMDEILVLTELREIIIDHIREYSTCLRKPEIYHLPFTLTPVQAKEFLGVTVDSQAIELQLPLMQI